MSHNKKNMKIEFILIWTWKFGASSTAILEILGALQVSPRYKISPFELLVSSEG
jgi:hypothetical protein